MVQVKHLELNQLRPWSEAQTVIMSKKLGMGYVCRPLVWVHFPAFFLPCIKLKMGKSIFPSPFSRFGFSQVLTSGKQIQGSGISTDCSCFLRCRQCLPREVLNENKYDLLLSQLTYQTHADASGLDNLWMLIICPGISI